VDEEAIKYVTDQGGSAFDPETVIAMALAFGKACQELGSGNIGRPGNGN
jgi:hypothetical protein